MSRKQLRWLILAVFIALLLAGCRCDNSVIPTFYGIADLPGEGEVTDLNPIFDWHGSDSCQPDEYILHVEQSDGSTGPIHTNIAESNLPYAYSGSNFQPVRAYTWKLTAVNGAQGNLPPVFGPETEVGHFFTGPICAGEALIAPELSDPEPAGWVEEEYVFKWTYTGGCLPSSYEVQFARDAAFTDVYLTANTQEPYAQELLMAFPDCSSLFWRVRASDGSSFGPWSDGRDFHYVLSTGCYQWHYLSDDFAWLNVRLRLDTCQQTGLLSAITASLDPGCVANGMLIIGDGTQTTYMEDYVVDLGSGPCPSTGLDQKSVHYSAKFGVLTPGTYCVSISRNQVVGTSTQYNLMDGLWTNPRVNAIVAEEEIQLGPGNQDLKLDFVWDEYEHPFLTVPLDHTYNCRIGPQKICPTVDFAPAGEAIPIIARDQGSDWKLTQLNGAACYINLSAALIKQYMPEVEDIGERIAGLPYFHPPDPCLEPESSSQPKPCSSYTDPNSCRLAGCTWNEFVGRTGGGECVPKQ